MINLPNEFRFELDSLHLLVCHGSPWSLEEYIYPDNQYLERFAQVDADVIIMGHTHIPWQGHVKGKWLINPGSCGQPRDYQPSSSYAVFDTTDMRLDFCRVEYDLQGFVQELRNQEYPEQLIKILQRRK